MKIKINKKKIKCLSLNAKDLPSNVTPQVGGAWQVPTRGRPDWAPGDSDCCWAH
ncbi:hypothetical protein J8M21_12245 [Pseudoalteromonas luteoviolacea]|uniref:hypothetical protein n=1 Tax=Pseudoalteromonas luteoviolacea TaxID=43657 RepID=UPI001B39DF12|nr:hypothetical protein [Pseudoalteromonas luteoviolacea]MBQ4877978.1 hypothetical protein [Pseudoalteromonas luteoviolacea]MBQ4907013.1 hypothetical protein [Pseudoalteromonas luteoviolacea]